MDSRCSLLSEKDMLNVFRWRMKSNSYILRKSCAIAAPIQNLWLADDVIPTVSLNSLPLNTVSTPVLGLKVSVIVIANDEIYIDEENADTGVS